MQKKISENGLTTKYIHNDGSETSFKISHSGRFNSENLIVPITEDKEKYSLVISCSKGCQMRCSFCHLTQKSASFTELSNDQVEKNIKEVILDQIKQNPFIANKHIKLCWMGMGEAILKPKMIKEVSINVINWVLEKNYAAGVDGIDISTVLPKVSNRWYETIENLVKETETFPRNPHNSKNRTLVRLFYSLHTANQELRDEIIPNTKEINVAIEGLNYFSKKIGIDIIYHYMFMNDINDSNVAVEELIELYKENKLFDSELRILRYNEATNGVTESSDLKSIIEILENNIPKLKVQHSSGNSVASSCGMFIVKEIV